MNPARLSSSFDRIQKVLTGEDGILMQLIAGHQCLYAYNLSQCIGVRLRLRDGTCSRLATQHPRLYLGTYFNMTVSK